MCVVPPKTQDVLRRRSAPASPVCVLHAGADAVLRSSMWQHSWMAAAWEPSGGHTRWVRDYIRHARRCLCLVSQRCCVRGLINTEMHLGYMHLPVTAHDCVQSKAVLYCVPRRSQRKRTGMGSGCPRAASQSCSSATSRYASTHTTAACVRQARD